MTPPSHRIFENRKYMWDGVSYPQEADASRAAETYRASGFDVRLAAEGGEWLVFTRREASGEPSKS